MRVFVLSLLAASTLLAANRIEIDISASQIWTDTGIDLRVGDNVTITAIGDIQLDFSRTCGPDGLPRTWGDVKTSYPVVNSGRGALIGRFTENPAARGFFVGSFAQRNVPVSGHLFLGVNETAGQLGAGSFHVTVQWSPSSTTPVAYYAVFPQQMLDGIPSRVTDIEGNLGDRVNFIIVGSQQRLLSALSDAGWMLADRTKKESVLHGVLTTLSKEAYVAMPMSELFLFGRAQDYGYVQADPLKAIASRHHFRLWKTPYTLYGEPVWAGAGTHDVGFDKDVRDNGLAHKIDPATDGERDYIGQSIQLSGFAVREDLLMPHDPIRQARTATGGGFISDGRTLVVFLQP
jgi:hypothetical protein